MGLCKPQAGSLDHDADFLVSSFKRVFESSFMADKVEQPIIPPPYNSPGAIAPITIDQSPHNQHRQEYIGQFRQQLFYDELEQNYF